MSKYKTESITRYQVTIDNVFMPKGDYVSLETYQKVENELQMERIINLSYLEQNKKLTMLLVKHGLWEVKEL